MPPSQLRRLKTSLREQGVTGPQKSKKQKKQASKNGSFRDSRIQRNAALQGIREQFNPFEVRAPARLSKHDVVSSRGMAGRIGEGTIARPGVTKGFGEEQVCRYVSELFLGMLTNLSSAVRHYLRRCNDARRLGGSSTEELEKMTPR